MSTSKKESVLQALDAKLQTLQFCDYKREDVEPDDVGIEGTVRLYDGEMGEPIDIAFSPTTYFWQHRAQIVVTVQDNDIARRVATMDSILTGIQKIVDEDTTLGGLCDFVETLPPEDDTEAYDGAPSIKRSFVGVVLHYTSASSLG